MNNKLWLIWKHPETRRRYKVGTLTCENTGYIFEYTNPELDDALNNGFDYFPGFEDLKKIYTNEFLFANIETRLPNEKREDYLEVLNSYNLNRNSSKFDILKATRGRLLTDNYEFVLPFDKSKIEFDIAGTRHYIDAEKYLNIISVNDELKLEIDENNKYDKYAIKIFLQKNNIKTLLGYVPRYYTKELFDLLNKNVEYSAMVKSLNFESVLPDEDISVIVKLIFNSK